MERKKRLSKRTASVRIEPYLAEYIQKKLEIEPETGGVKIPYTTDLYHVVWNCMAKPDSHHDVMQDCNLKIYLPSRRSKMDGHPGKDPAYYNYLSSNAAKKIEEHIRLLFNFEFHRLMIENEELGRPLRNQDVVDNFIRRYSLRSISPDALLKNFYRYRQRLFPKTPRKYKKNGVFNYF